MKFQLFGSEPFLRVIESVYDLSRVAVLSPDADGSFPFFRSNKPLRGHDLFALPFGYYRTAQDLRQRWSSGQWEAVKRFSADQRCNITMTILGDAQIDGGVVCADNPVLSLNAGQPAGERYTRNLRLNLKKEWNKCERHGVRIEFTEREDDLRAFYRVLATQYVREHRMVFQPLCLFERLMRLEGVAKLLVARSDEHGVVGGLFMLSDGPVLHYNWGARLQVANVSVGTVLIDHAIRHAEQAGYQHFNFGSTALSDRNLLDFKLKWGCENVPVYRYHTLTRPADVDLASSYGAARWLFSRLPVRAAAALMPFVIPWLIR